MSTNCSNGNLSPNCDNSDYEWKTISRERIADKSSALVLLQEMQDDLEQCFLNWYDVICEIGHPDEFISEWGSIFRGSLQQRQRELLNDANHVKRKMLSRAQHSLRRIASLSKLLGRDNTTVTREDNVPLKELESKLEKKIKQLEADINQRTVEFNALNTEQVELCMELGIPVKFQSDAPILNDDELTHLKTFILDLKTKKSESEATLKRLQQNAQAIIAQLQWKPTEANDMKYFDSDGTLQLYKLDLINDYQVFVDKLRRMAEENKKECLRLRLDIDRMWDILDVPIEERDRFRNAHKGCSCVTFDALKTEMARCKQIKSQNIQSYIEKSKQLLKQLCENCHADMSVYDAPFFYSTLYNEDLLDIIDREVIKWSKIYEDNKPIFDIITAHKKAMDELEQMEMNPVSDVNERFRNRGGALLAEEKRKKRLQKIISQKEQQLRKIHQEKKGFLISGQNLETYLDMMQMDYNNRRKNMLSVRKNKKNIETASPKVVDTQIRKQLFNTPKSSSVMRTRITPSSSRTSPKTKKLSVLVSDHKSKAARRRRSEENKQKRQFKLANVASSSKQITIEEESEYEDFEEEVHSNPACRSSTVNSDSASSTIVRNFMPHIVITEASEME